MKGAIVGAAIIAALALQTSPFFGRNGAGIDLVLVVVVWTALQFGPATGLMTGAAAGLAQDVLSAGIIGVGGFSKTLVGFGAGAVGSQFIVANAGTRSSCCCCAALTSRVPGPLRAIGGAASTCPGGQPDRWRCPRPGRHRVIIASNGDSLVPERRRLRAATSVHGCSDRSTR